MLYRNLLLHLLNFKKENCLFEKKTVFLIDVTCKRIQATMLLFSK